MKDQEEVRKLLDNPECKKCIEDLASKPGFQDMVKAVDEEAFKALQEYNANKKGENGKGPIEEKQKLWQAMAPVVGGVVVMGFMCYLGRDRKPTGNRYRGRREFLGYRRYSDKKVPLYYDYDKGRLTLPTEE
jgi:hypothetical protein